jgi:carboxypeptidase family protein/TonB-dependent receptor-like protein
MNSAIEVCKRCWGAHGKKTVQLLGGVLAVLLLCLPAFSQGSFGRILGTVTDQSGGVIAGATVTVIDTERGVSRTLTTDDAGAYNAPNLTAGNYTVRVEAKGFKRLERQSIGIEVGHEVRVDLTVQPGEQTQTVTVTEAVPLVETTNASLTSTLENADIIDLPLNGRDYQNLLGLRPGVMLQPGGGPWTQSTNGARPDESVWLIEGIINANPFDARPVINMPSPFTDGATILPVDAIQEFNLQENPKAEYGWKSGAIVNVGIKSGTNSLHGDAYAFGRYQNWDARNYFNIASPAGCSPALLLPSGQCPQTDAQLKQFGGVAGGPIIKDKLFFFGGYEGLRSLIGFVGGIQVPALPTLGGDPVHSMVDAITALQAKGIPVSSVSTKLTGCTTGATPVCTGMDGSSQLFPNIGASTSFLSTFPTINTSDNGVGKMDYHANDKNSFNGMFFYGHYNAIGEDHSFVSQNATDSAPITAMTITSSWVYTPNSNTVNELRFGYDRTSFSFINIDVGSSSTTYGINTGVTNALAGGLPSIVINGFGNGGTPVVGTAFNRPQYFTPNPYWDLQDSVSLLKGKHSIKIGGEFTHLEADAAVFNNGRGRFNFFGNGAFANSTPLEDFFAGTLSAPPGGSAATLLSGQPSSKLTSYNYAAYVQDDWRITPRLIINAGLRYNLNTPMKDALGNIGNFDPTSPTGMVQQGQPGWDTIWKTDPFDFEPRIGMAWDMKGNGTTVMRLGVGLIHETWNLETFEGQFIMQGDGSTAINAIPTGAAISCGISSPTLLPSIICPSSGGGTNNLGSAGFSPNQLCWDPTVTTGPAHTAACVAGQTTVLPGSTGGPKCGDGVLGNPSPCDLMSVNPNLKVPFVVNYNLGITHAFGSNLSLEVEYVGNHGYRLLSFTDINQAPLGAAYCMNTPTAAQAVDACAGGTGSPVQEARPYFNKFPYLGYIYQVGNKDYSNYNSLQVSLTKRLSHGLLFNVGYTYGHGLDNGSLNRFGLNPENSNNLAQDYASSDFDVRHRLTATATYNIPGVKGFGQLLEGWQINTIVTFATAQPWQTFDAGDNFSGTGENADRWNIFGNPSDFPSGKNSIPDCMANPGTTFAVGNVSCTVTSIYGGTTTLATAAQVNGCLAHSATSGALNTPLANAGCYVSANGNSFITPPALGTFGNMGRNILRDSGFKDWDFSIFKNFTFKERYGIQARWEVFNALNHPIAANPSGASSAVNTGNSPGPNTAFGASFLTPDFAAGNPLIGSGSQRVMQVGLKLTF